MFDENWKTMLLSRYCGEFLPADYGENSIRKSSEDIAFDLSEMGELSKDEVSAYLVVNGYKIDFDGEGKPVWLLRPPGNANALPE